ncbi:MAG: hypothetical protein JST24_05415 [Acidobacteria bacterium]|nr:hypothetical protein [Acidobacteriota bacterium]
MLSLLTLLLAPTALPARLPEPTALVRVDDDDHGKRGRKAWKHERKEREKAWRKWAKHHDDDEGRDDRDWDFHHPRHEHRCPPWMDPWWGARRGPRYVAVVPGDPSRCYVLLDGRWVLRRVRDGGFQADLGDVMRFPAAPPPVPLPRVGLNLHIVLFN